MSPTSLSPSTSRTHTLSVAFGSSTGPRCVRRLTTHPGASLTPTPCSSSVAASTTAPSISHRTWSAFHWSCLMRWTNSSTLCCSPSTTMTPGYLRTGSSTQRSSRQCKKKEREKRTHPGFERPYRDSSVLHETMSLRLLVARRWCDQRSVVLRRCGPAAGILKGRQLLSRREERDGRTLGRSRRLCLGGRRSRDGGLRWMIGEVGLEGGKDGKDGQLRVCAEDSAEASRLRKRERERWTYPRPGPAGPRARVPP